jgi:hypothetical protein
VYDDAAGDNCNNARRVFLKLNTNERTIVFAFTFVAEEIGGYGYIFFQNNYIEPNNGHVQLRNDRTEIRNGGKNSAILRGLINQLGEMLPEKFRRIAFKKFIQIIQEQQLFYLIG